MFIFSRRRRYMTTPTPYLRLGAQRKSAPTSGMPISALIGIRSRRPRLRLPFRQEGSLRLFNGQCHPANPPKRFIFWNGRCCNLKRAIQLNRPPLISKYFLQDRNKKSPTSWQQTYHSTNKIEKLDCAKKCRG